MNPDIDYNLNEEDHTFLLVISSNISTEMPKSMFSTPQALLYR